MRLSYGTPQAQNVSALFRDLTIAEQLAPSLYMTSHHITLFEGYSLS